MKTQENLLAEIRNSKPNYEALCRIFGKDHYANHALLFARNYAVAGYDKDKACELLKESFLVNAGFDNAVAEMAASSIVSSCEYKQASASRIHNGCKIVDVLNDEVYESTIQHINLKDFFEKGNLCNFKGLKLESHIFSSLMIQRLLSTTPVHITPRKERVILSGKQINQLYAYALEKGYRSGNIIYTDSSDQVAFSLFDQKVFMKVNSMQERFVMHCAASI